MTHNRSLPAGTRDILPTEMRELRDIERRLVSVFESSGYGEVLTPAIEFLDVLAHGDVQGAPAAYSFFGEDGELLALRSDMTVPIARLAASRLGAEPLPWRLFYLGTAYRSAGAQRGQMREMIQAGIELVGGDASSDQDAEVVAVLDAALESCGLTQARIIVGDAGLYPALLDGFGVAEVDRERLLGLLASHDFVGLKSATGSLGLPAEAVRALVDIPRLRGGDAAAILDRAGEIGGEVATAAVAGIAGTHKSLVERGVAGRVQLDLGLVRELGYYTGMTLEVFDPALGYAIGGGGRYDRLFGTFGRELPAAGFALDVARVHAVKVGTEVKGS